MVRFSCRRRGQVDQRDDRPCSNEYERGQDCNDAARPAAGRIVRRTSCHRVILPAGECARLGPSHTRVRSLHSAEARGASGIGDAELVAEAAAVGVEVGADGVAVWG